MTMLKSSQLGEAHDLVKRYRTLERMLRRATDKHTSYPFMLRIGGTENTECLYIYQDDDTDLFKDVVSHIAALGRDIEAKLKAMGVELVRDEVDEFANCTVFTEAPANA